jgi:hypothetical protein
MGVPASPNQGHYGFMVMLGRALVILPGDSSQESGGYDGACEALGLRVSPHGHVIYLVETSPGSLMLASAELGEQSAIWGAERGHANRSGSHNTGEQHGGTAMLRGLRTSASGAEVVEISLPDHPIAQVVVKEPSGTFEDVGVEAHPVAEPEGPVEKAVREAFADVLAETLVGAIWPAFPSTGVLKNYESLYQAAKLLLEPEILLLKLINASVRGAAHAAGLGIVAPLAGQLAEDLCAPLLRPGPEEQAGSDMLKIIDIELYAEDGHLAECPALRGLTIQSVAAGIGKLLEPRSGPRTADPADLRPTAWSPRGSLPRSSSGGSQIAAVGSPAKPVAGGTGASVTKPTDPEAARACARNPNSVAKSKGQPTRRRSSPGGGGR